MWTNAYTWTNSAFLRLPAGVRSPGLQTNTTTAAWPPISKVRITGWDGGGATSSTADPLALVLRSRERLSLLRAAYLRSPCSRVPTALSAVHRASVLLLFAILWCSSNA